MNYKLFVESVPARAYVYVGEQKKKCPMCPMCPEAVDTWDT